MSDLIVYDDAYFMKKAYEEARRALEKDEVPIGAIMVANNSIIAKAHNLTETLNDVTAHAEMQAITSAANYIGGKYLNKCTLYVTMEPCQMCAGALYWSQIERIVYGCDDDKRGYRVMGAKLHPKTAVSNGVMHDECSAIVKDFFKSKR